MTVPLDGGGLFPHRFSMSDSTPTHFIIKLQVAKKGSPHKQDQFVRNEHYDAHVYQDKAFPLSELNDLYPKVLEQYWDYELPAPAPMPPIPVLVKPQMAPNMAKARAALAELNAKKKENEGATGRGKKRLLKKNLD